MMKNGSQNGFKKQPKWNHTSPGPRIFEILARSGRRCFLNVFGNRKKSAQNLEKSAGGATKKVSGLIVGRPGGMRGAAGEVRRGLKTPPGSARILARNLKPRVLGFGILGPAKNLSVT